jgi:hypothetical protein
LLDIKGVAARIWPRARVAPTDPFFEPGLVRCDQVDICFSILESKASTERRSARAPQ